jgi:hypothetical protein
VTVAFAIAAIAVSLVWLAIIAIAAVRGLRWLAERGTRHHDLGPKRFSKPDVKRLHGYRAEGRAPRRRLRGRDLPERRAALR